MNIFIKDKESGIYYNLFNVSSIKISIREFSNDKDVIDIDVYNETLHVYVGCIHEKKCSMKEYRDLEHCIKTNCALFIGGDRVSEVE